MGERQLRRRKEGQKQTGQERESKERPRAGEVGCCTGDFPKKLKKVMMHMVIKGGPLSAGKRT